MSLPALRFYALTWGLNRLEVIAGLFIVLFWLVMLTLVALRKARWAQALRIWRGYALTLALVFLLLGVIKSVPDLWNCLTFNRDYLQAEYSSSGLPSKFTLLENFLAASCAMINQDDSVFLLMIADFPYHYVRAEYLLAPRDIWALPPDAEYALVYFRDPLKLEDEELRNILESKYEKVLAYSESAYILKRKEER